jgi:uncharacterized protein YndB with AHSA1/START domain
LENFARIQHTLQASPERVFQALVDSSTLTQWFSEFADVAVEAKTYDFWGRYTPEAPTSALGRHPLTNVTTNRQLSYSWQLNGVATNVTFKLLNRQSETILTVRHTAPKESQLTSGWGLEDFWMLSLENLRRQLEGQAVIARMDFTKPMQGDIHHEILIDAPASTVYAILTRPEQIDRWIGNNAEVEPEVGGVYSFGWMGMKILEIVPDQKISVIAPTDGSGTGETIATWTLAESNGKTRLTFVHSGFAPDTNNSGLNIGWLNFLNFISSLAEVGAQWLPPLPVINPDFGAFYPTTISARQGEIVDELRDANDSISSQTA